MAASSQLLRPKHESSLEKFMAKIGVIINPHSKKNKKNIDKVYNDFTTIGGDVADVRVTKDLSEIDMVLKDFVKQKIEYMGISGGDGTVHHILSKYIKVYGTKNIPALLILKGGTMDNISRTINLKGKGNSILQRFANNVRNGKTIVTHERDTMKVEDKYCFLFGAGLVSNFLNEIYKGEKGFVANVRVTFKTIMHSIKEPAEGSLLRGINAEITCDGKKLPFTFIRAILVATVEHIGMGFSPLPRANEKPFTFHSIISGVTPGVMVKNILNLKNGKEIIHPMHVDDLFGKMVINSKEKFEYNLDGDMYDCDGRLTVEAGPRIRLVYV
jgi:diacylglycerol kinase family enzyme